MTTKVESAEKPAVPSELSERIQRMIEEQGVAQTATFEHLLGKGADLWETDAEFDEFIKLLDERRHEKE